MNVLYIPGLGGRFVLSLQRIYLALLNMSRRKEQKIIVFNPKWHTDETFDTKFNRLKSVYSDHGRPKIVVAPSAGGSLGLVLSASNPVRTLHVVCGKLRGSEKIGQAYQKSAPALLDAVRASEACADSLQQATLICYVPDNAFDGVVDSEDMYVEHAEIVTLPNLRHSRAIAHWLFRFLPRI